MVKVIFLTMMITSACLSQQVLLFSTDVVSGVPPATPTLATPANSATGVSLTPTLTWGAVSGTNSYDVQVDDNNDFSSMVVSSSSASASYNVTGGLSGSVVYYWRVRAGNGFGYSAYSSIFSFTTAGGAATVWDFNFEEADLAAFQTASGWTSTGAPTLSATQSHLNTKSLFVNAGGYAAQNIISSSVNYSEIFVSFWVYQTARSSDGPRGVVWGNTVGGHYYILKITGTGTIQLHAYSTNVGETVGTIALNTWTKVTCHWRFNGASSLYEVNLGAETVSGNTNIATTNISSINLGADANSSALSIYVDEFKVSIIGYP